MYRVNILNYRDDLLDLLPESKGEKITALFKNIAFKLEKNLYYYTEISNNVKKISDPNNFVEMLPIYFDLESLLISFRSSIDVVLHLMNDVLELNLEAYDVNLGSVYRCFRRGSQFHNIFSRYTRRNSNEIWKFIYYFRNDIVHEKSIYEVMDFFIEGEDKHFFIDYRGKKEHFDSHIKNCFRLVDGFCREIFTAMVLYLKQKRK